MKKVKGRNGGTLSVPEKGETNNPNGRPVGSFSFKWIAERLLDGKITMEEAGQKREMSKKEAIVLSLIDDAINAQDPNVRRNAAKMIFDRVDPMQKEANQNDAAVPTGQLPASFTESPTFVVVGGTMDMIESEDDLPEDSDE